MLRRDVQVPLATVMILCFALAFVLGTGAGFYAGWYTYVRKPALERQKEMEKQAKETEKMTRRGAVVAVTPTSLTVKVTEGGGDVNKTKTYYSNHMTRVQVGPVYVGGGDINGPPVDLTKWFAKNDFVHFIVKDSQILSIYRALRPGENPPQITRSKGQ